MDIKQIAKGYRDRAEELRTLARSFEHHGARLDLITLAENWERMAERIEARVPPDVLAQETALLQRKIGN